MSEAAHDAADPGVSMARSPTLMAALRTQLAR
jgi:hypothetical protein